MFKRERRGLEGDGHQSESGISMFLSPTCFLSWHQAKATRTSVAEQHAVRKVLKREWDISDARKVVKPVKTTPRHANGAGRCRKRVLIVLGRARPKQARLRAWCNCNRITACAERVVALLPGDGKLRKLPGRRCRSESQSSGLVGHPASRGSPALGFVPTLSKKEAEFFFVIVIVLRNIVLLRLGQQFLLSGLGSVPQSLFAAVLRPLFKMLHSLLANIGLHIFIGL